MIEELKNNIDIEIKMTKELASFLDRSEHGELEEKRLFNNMADTLARKIKIINKSNLYLIKNTSFAKKLPTGQTQKSDKEIERLNLSDKSNESVVLSKADKKEFLEELNISENLVRKIKKKVLVGDEIKSSIRKPSVYGKVSNKFFLKSAEKWIKNGKFKNLSLDIKRSNLNILKTTYISMMFFSISLSVILGVIIFAVFTLFSFSLGAPFISLNSGRYLGNLIKMSWIPITIPLLTWASFYLYPGTEKRSLSKRIDQELPFVVIHMGSISGSGIEPIEIFRIIGLSKEYKHTGKEIRKILNQTNVYGYDLTTSLRDVARSSPSPRLSELFNGISVIINSGGDIKTFFEKRAESLLLEYRLEREKSIKTAETFMDIYISIVIATPMILLLLLVMISVSGISTGFSLNELTVAIIAIVAMINILFLTFLHIKQPVY